MQFHFEAEQWVPHPVEMVFAFFADPNNLPPLMPRWQKARIEDARIVPPPPMPKPAARRRIAAGEGTELTISFRPIPFSPIRLPWEGIITEFAWNDHFCDEIRRGPFRYWRHCHRVSEEQRDGRTGTKILDDVTYELSFTFLSGLANALVARRQLRSLFRYRHRRLEEILGR